MATSKKTDELTLEQREEALRKKEEELAAKESAVQEKEKALAAAEKDIDAERAKVQSEAAKKVEQGMTPEKEARLLESIEKMGEALIEVKGNQVTGTQIKVFTPDEYKKFSAESGLAMGRRLDQKIPITVEELRAYINADWTPKMVMEKYGLDAEDLKQAVWALSKKELRQKPIKFSIEQNFFGKEG